jgi:hypothetical protein
VLGRTYPGYVDERRLPRPMHAAFGTDVPKVNLDGVLADPELAGDLSLWGGAHPVAPPRAEHGDLAVCEGHPASPKPFCVPFSRASAMATYSASRSMPIQGKPSSSRPSVGVRLRERLRLLAGGRHRTLNQVRVPLLGFGEPSNRFILGTAVNRPPVPTGGPTVLDLFQSWSHGQLLWPQT